ncbi:hypothetical protein DRP05_11685 [Archaeoglobales archaeon]|nr:MAG: hypothetical protein DRP05_11685 [Archaeoglobales archaeon]
MSLALKLCESVNVKGIGINFSDPNIVVTTWDDIRFLVVFTGIVCLVAGFVIAEIRHYLKRKYEKEKEA